MKREPDLATVARSAAFALRAGPLRWTVAAILAVTAWMLFWYAGTAAEVGRIWWRDQTYAHGLAVFPIFAWLVWRGRDRLALLAPQPAPSLALAVALAGAGWLLGRMVGVAALAHFSLFAMLVAGLAAVLGWRIARVLAFPLLFLFFGVPLGDFLLPVLMDQTAQVTVAALRLSGIPVYQEGLLFVVPNGRWSVVEACSGIRYLIASVMVGTLYAYLNYRSLKRRLLFVGVAVAVPIVANWLRAYLIVILGYLSDNRIAAGVDHFIYGWLFFGVVVLAMFWIGGRWREERALRVVSGLDSGPAAAPGRWWGLAPLAVLTAAFPLLLRQLEAPVQPFAVSLQAPTPGAGWQPVADDPFRGYRPRFRGQRGELFRAYRNSEGVVGLYVAYFARQRQGAELVMWGNGPAGTEKDEWKRVQGDADVFDTGPVRRDLLARGGERLAVWSWYWVDGRPLTSDYGAKARLALDRLTGRPDDSAFVAVIAAVDEGPAHARPLVAAFLQDHGEAIAAMLENAEVRP